MTTQPLLAPVVASRDREATHRRPDIQGLRAVAVLMVIGFHAGLPIPGGFAGVDVFFVISGFVITAMLHREWLSTGRIRLGRFYARRFRRLTPPLALMVAIVLPLCVLFTSPIQTLLRAAVTGGGALLLVANVVLGAQTGDYFSPAADTNPMLHTWSLSVEEQFYLVFPAILALCWWARRRRRLNLGVAAVGTIVVASFLAGVLGTDQVHSFYSPFTRGWEFAVGALLAMVLAGRRDVAPRFATGTASLGIAALLASCWLISGRTVFPGYWTLLPVLGTAALIAAGSLGPNPVSRALSAKAPVGIGDASYSLYLWHWAPIVFASTQWPGNVWATFLAAAVSVVPAVLSHRLVEVPCRTPPTRDRPTLRLAATTLVPSVLVCVLILTAALDGLGDPLVQRYSDQLTPLPVAGSACILTGGPDAWQASDCTWNAAARGAPIYVAGDSVAEQYSQGLIAAGSSLGRPVVVLTHVACPFLDAQLWNPEVSRADNLDCQAHDRWAAGYLASRRGGLVVLSASDRYLLRDGFGFGASPDQMVSDPAARLELWTRATSRTVRQLEAAGHRVLLIPPTPRWDGGTGWNPTRCTGLDLALNRANWCRADMPRAEAEARQAMALAAVRQVATDTGASVFDPWPLLCPGVTCATAAGDLIRYRDAEHISNTQSLALAPALAVAASAAGG